MRISSSLLCGLSSSIVLVAACVSDTTTTTNPTPDSGEAPDTSVADSGQADTSVADSSVPDSSVADAADAAPPWSPASLAGLVVWLDGSKGVSVSNGTVQNWHDQSNNNNNAFNLTPANQPTTVASVVNGLPVIRFDGSGKQWLNIFDTATLQFGTADFAIVEVMAYTNVASSNGNTGYGALWVKSGPNGPFPGAALFGNDPTVPNASIRAQVTSGLFADTSKTSFNDGKFHIVGMRRSGTTMEVRADGAQGGTLMNATTDISAAGSDVWIGGRGGSSFQQALKGDIAEIIVVKGTVSDPNIASVEGYLKTKYAL